MIEGSEAMYMATKAYTHLYLSFIAPKFKKSDGFREIEDNFDILFSQKIGEDILLYLKAENGR